MGKSPAAPLQTRKGSSTAAEIYLSVGVALSWWESSEDILMGVFRWLCSKAEPTAFETYVASSRSARSKMLLSALERYKRRFLESEVQTIRAAMRALDRLASMRNQIAHGHVVRTKSTIDEVLVMDGHFLQSALNEAGEQILPDIRYAHTGQEIEAWTLQVRGERAKIMDAHLAARLREQTARQSASPQDITALSVIEAINEGRVSVSDFSIVHKSALVDQKAT